ncbi:hypothetical protein TA3x_002030 [Tundrisphaera sp. TA3]
MFVRCNPGLEPEDFFLGDGAWSPATRALGIEGSELMWDAVLACWQPD